MKTTVGSAVALAVITVAVGQAWADGKFYERETVPPGIPYQRAFLLFHDGTEMLTIQSKYGLSQAADANSIGWVVPVPDVPELASMNAWTAHFYFSDLAFWTPPKYLIVSKYVGMAGVVMILGGLLLIGASLLTPWVGEIRVRKGAMVNEKALARLLVGGHLVAFLGVIAIVVGGTRRTTAGFGASTGVEVVKAEQVGIYDVRVVKSDTVEPIMTWLTENGFHFDNRDKAAFADYVSKRWCFVVAKVGAEARPASRSLEGLTDPLVLTFRTDKPIYPLALTATVGVNTEVLLYTLSANKLACGRRLPLRYAYQIKPLDFANLPAIMSGSNEQRLFGGMPKEITLCKFRGTLTPGQMKEDLVFKPAPDNTPYHETKIVW